MTWRATTKLHAYLVLVAAGLVTGLAMRRPEPVALVAPLALIVAIGLGLTRPVALSVRTALDKSRVTEGDDVALSVLLSATEELSRLEVFVDLPHGVTAQEPGGARGLTLRAGEQRAIAARLRAEQWGTYELGTVVVLARGWFGLLAAEGQHTGRLPLTVYPRPDAVRRLVRARHTQTAPGSQLARAKGAGVEFADARPFTPGDRVREVNWRMTARRGAVWVNERHPDRSTDIVVFLDTFGGPTLPAAVRAADSLVSAYLGQRDRVGLVGFGGSLRWLRPGMGLRQQYLVVDALLATRVFPSVAWKGISLLPPRVLPPKALVIAVSPLDDERTLAALIDLRERGIDLVIVEVSPLPYVPPGPTPADVLAHRLWRLRRDVLRDRYRSLGIPTIEWSEGRPLAEAIEEVRAWPRTGRQRVG